MTPGVRVVTIAAAALAALEFARFALGLAVGNAIFVGGHFVLGLAVGKPALAIVSSSGGLVLVALGLLALGAAGWWAIRRRRTTAGSSLGGGALAWADASCPACLCLAVIGSDRA